MLHSAKSKFAWLVVLLFTAAGIAAAQEKTTKKEAQPAGTPAEGARLYRDYCTGCHGKTGLGDGPAASVLNTKPSDLTTLTERHGGKFPAEYLEKVLRFGVKKPAHGTSDMPTWGPMFSGESNANPTVRSKRIADMISYLETLQKAPKKK
jgi:mono/diheme cytochrome c family protein